MTERLLTLEDIHRIFIAVRKKRAIPPFADYDEQDNELWEEIITAIKGAQREMTLREVREWGEQTCGNPKHLLPLLKKRNCIECWQGKLPEGG